MKSALRWSFPLVVLLLLGACKRNAITYYTTGIVLENYNNCGQFIQPGTGPIGDSCYVIRVNYESDQTQFNGVNDNNTYAAGNQLSSVTIYCLQTFDSSHAAGVSLNQYFIAGPRVGAVAEDIVTDFPDTQDFYPTHDPDDLWLMKAPQNPGTYSFVVKMAFDNGTIARDTTTVTLNQ